jgi:Spy/CpxP family protein refolding chaperone
MNTLCRKGLLLASAAFVVLTSVWSNALAAKPSTSTTSTVGSVAADGETGWQRQIFERVEHRIFKIVHANEQQKEKLTSIFNSTYELNADLRKDLKSRVLALSKTYADDSVTNDQIKEQVTAINDVRAKLNSKRLDALIAAREVLSSKQRQMLSERLNERLSDD